MNEVLKLCVELKQDAVSRTGDDGLKSEMRVPERGSGIPTNQDPHDTSPQELIGRSLRLYLLRLT